MSLVLLTNFITISKSGNNPIRYQNGKVDGDLNFKNRAYSYLSFIYQGAAKNRTGDNLESTLVFANNPLALNLAIDAVEGRWSVEVVTCSLNPDDFSNPKQLTLEKWIVSSVAYDPLNVELTLSSSIDAVGATAPNRTLTQKQVGALPNTARIQNR